MEPKTIWRSWGCLKRRGRQWHQRNDLYLEVGGGGGTATVDAGAGNDVVRVWQTKDVVYHGGAGSDTLIFQTYVAGPFPTEPSQGAVVNLKTGTGTNPWGGTLTLSGIDNIVGTDKGDHFVGNDRGDTFGDGIFDRGPDTIIGGAGNDTVNLAEGLINYHGGVVADGGGGVNTLAINFGLGQVAGRHKLDLLDQSQNTGVFQNDLLTNFQIFVHGTGFYAQDGQTFIFIDNHETHHTVEALGQTNNITFHGGNDALVLHDTVASG